MRIIAAVVQPSDMRIPDFHEFVYFCDKMVIIKIWCQFAGDLSETQQIKTWGEVRVCREDGEEQDRERACFECLFACSPTFLTNLTHREQSGLHPRCDEVV